jgi:hypothetical protein
VTAETVLALFLVAVLVAAVALIAYRTGHDRAADQWRQLWTADARAWQVEVDRAKRRRR